MRMKHDKEKKETTLDDLALMVGKGFNSMDEKFKNVDKRFESADKRFDKIESRLGKLEKGQEEIKDKLDKKVSNWEHKSLVHRVEDLELKMELSH